MDNITTGDKYFMLVKAPTRKTIRPADPNAVSSDLVECQSAG